MVNEKNRIEALLFTVAKRINLDEISKITGIRDPDKIKNALNELKLDYENKGNSMILNDEGEGYWKLTVKDHYMPMVNKVVNQMEMDRPLMETLAVIAWKYPVLQADVIKIRHNKAYEHLKRLEELGFVTRVRYGRTNKLTLTSKFFEYFDLPSKDQAKELFRDIIPEKVIAKIEKTEAEIDVVEKRLEEAKLKKLEMEKEKKLQEDGKEPQINPTNVEPKPDPEKEPVPIPEASGPLPTPEEPAPIPETTNGPLPEKEEPAPVPEAAEDKAKEELKELQEEEDNEIEQIEKDVEELDKEEEKKFYD